MAQTAGIPTFTTKSFILRRFFKITGRILLGILILLLGILLFLWSDTGQNWLVRQVSKRLSRDLQSHISIKHIHIRPFNRMDLEGLLVKDRHQDTLLYAGKFGVRITDWFFFKDKAELRYIALENAVIHLSRKDSVWNYNYLIDYFSPPSSGKKSESAGIEFNLKKVEVRNLAFMQKDGWIGKDMTVQVGALDLDANELSFNKKVIDIRDLTLTRPYFALFEYDGRRVIDTAIIKKDTAAKSPGGRPWDIRLATISLTDGVFRKDNDSLNATVPTFDGGHILFSKINGTLKNIGFSSDTVRGTVALATQERSGFAVQSLTAAVTIQPGAMIFDRLSLQTARSNLGDYLSFRYNSLADMNNFIHAVTMEAHFKNTSLTSDDIAFFAPPLKTWKKAIRVEGKVKGTVDDLSSDKIQIWAGANTYLNGAVSLKGLPDMAATLVKIKAASLKTTYADVASFVPAIRMVHIPALSKLAYLNFKGSYAGFIKDFATSGTIETALGTVQADISLKYNAKNPVYSGKIATSGFGIGQFINDPKMGSVAADIKIKGTGFNWQTLDANVDGTVQKFNYGRYTYQNITAKGRVSGKLFNGDFYIADTNAVLHLAGLVDLRGKVPVYAVKGDVAHANLKALQLTDNDLRVSGRFNVAMQGNSLSNLLGTAILGQISINTGRRQLAFDSLLISSDFINGTKTLKVASDELTATVAGNVDPAALPIAFTLFLSRYYPAYIRPPKTVVPQAFTYDITTGAIEDYLKLYDSRLSGFNNSHIQGSLNTAANTMTVDARIPQAAFMQYSLSDAVIKGSGDEEQLSLTVETQNAQVGDSLLFPQTSISLTAQNDVSRFTLNTTANQAINKAAFSGRVRTFSDGATILFDTSSFVLNGKVWSVEPGGELNFRKNTVVQGELLLKESAQQIRVWTQPDDVGAWNNLHVALNSINIGDFSPFLLKRNRIEGLLSGEIVVEDPKEQFNVTGSIRTDQLRLDNDSLGHIETELKYISRTGLLTGSGANSDPEHHIEFDLSMNLKDSVQAANDRISARAQNFQLKYLERFLGSLFSDIQGYLTGNIDILGGGDARDYIAKATLKDASFMVNFTKVRYKVDDTRIELKKDLIDLNGIRLRDSLGNTALVKGAIKHHGFQKMNFDIAMQTESRQMILINTTYRDNQQFFGKAIGAGAFYLLGPEDDLLMNIEAKASADSASKLTILPSEGRETGIAPFIIERKYGREMTSTELSKGAANLKINVVLDATPQTNIELVLDQEIGDVIKANGTGHLEISTGTSEPLSLRGRYDILGGAYNYTFQSFVNKPFVLKRGGNNYIEWNGDPLDANLHIEATYTANNVSFAPLANTLDPTAKTGLSNLRDSVNVIATLDGKLFSPEFKFQLQFPPTLQNNQAIAFGLQQIQKNESELLKQVASLILVNSFSPPDNSNSSAYNPLNEFTYNTISGLLFNELSKQLNQLFSKFLSNNKLTLNFTGSVYNRNLTSSKSSFLPNQGNAILNLSGPLLKGRARFTVGGNFDVPLQSDFQQQIRLLPDVNLEFLVNQSGSVRATFFYRQSIDFLTGTGQTNGTLPRRYGASMSYNKEFDHLFRRRKKPVKDSVNKPPVTIQR